MKSLFSILLILVLSCAPYFNEANIIDSYYEIKDFSIYAVENIWLQSNPFGHVKLSFYHYYPGKIFTMPDSIYMYLSHYDNKIKYFNCQQIDLSIDSKTYSVPINNISKNILNEKELYEKLEFKLPLELFEKITKSLNPILLKVCNDTYQISVENNTKLINFFHTLHIKKRLVGS